MRQASRTRLLKILALLGSDQEGERASAALAAHRLVASSGESWADLIQPAAAAAVRTVVRHVHQYGVDEKEAAEARLRQLRDNNERLERQVKTLRRRVANLVDKERRRSAATAESPEGAEDSLD